MLEYQIQRTLSPFLHLLQLQEVQWALGHAVTLTLLRQRSSIAMFSGSRHKTTQDSRKGLSLENPDKNFEVCLVLDMSSIINGFQIVLSCAWAKDSSKHNLS